MAGPGAAKSRTSLGIRSLLVLAGLVAASALLCYALKGTRGVAASFDDSVSLLAAMVPRMIGALAIAGFVQALVPKDLVGRWLGDEGGLRGLAFATVAGMVTPGGPMLSFPLVVALKAAGANVPTLIAYLTAWSLLGVHRIVMWEIPLLGTKFAAVRFLASLPMPFLAGALTRVLLARLGPVL